MKILIIDDEIHICNILKQMLLEKNIGDITICDNAIDGEKEINKDLYDIVILDIIMPKKSGYEIMNEAKKNGIKSEFIILSGVYDPPMIVKCIKAGAYDYLVKPLSLDIVISAVTKAFEYRTMKNTVELFTAPTEIEIPETFKNFYTNDLNMKKIISYACKIGSMDCNVLIMGETGTGKELFAKSIHATSKRENKNFVAVNINAIPQNLFESSLFGYKKGSFTGALKDETGYCQKANNGTLFLDEIGDLDLSSQIKLLRLIEEKKFYRVGSNELEQSDFRLITATNKNLSKEVQTGKFRSDLYYRLKSGYIYIPPLRERGNDIIYISKLLLSQLCKKSDMKKEFTADSLFKLQELELKGNYRELSHIIENAFIKCSDELITPDYIEIEDETSDNKLSSRQNIFTLSQIKKFHIQKVLKLFKTKKEAAAVLGITERQLYNYLAEFNKNKQA